MCGVLCLLASSVNAQFDSSAFAQALVERASDPDEKRAVAGANALIYDLVRSSSGLLSRCSSPGYATEHYRRSLEVIAQGVIGGTPDNRALDQHMAGFQTYCSSEFSKYRQNLLAFVAYMKPVPERRRLALAERAAAEAAAAKAEEERREERNRQNAEIEERTREAEKRAAAARAAETQAKEKVAQQEAAVAARLREQRRRELQSGRARVQTWDDAILMHDVTDGVMLVQFPPVQADGKNYSLWGMVREARGNVLLASMGNKSFVIRLTSTTVQMGTDQPRVGMPMRVIGRFEVGGSTPVFTALYVLR